MEAAVAALQAEVGSLRAEHQSMMSKLVAYEQQQTGLQAALTKTVNEELENVAGGLRNLYAKTAEAVTGLEKRVLHLERDRMGKEHKTLLNTKDMKPNILNKDDEWRRWKSDIEDYAEEVFHGMKDMLDQAKGAENEISEMWFDAAQEQWWNKAEMLYRFLKRYTGTEARRIVLGVSDDNGWEAWRKLNQQYEPGTVTREAQVLARYTNMVNRKAKTPKETKALMIELNERAKRVEEITGRPVEDRHAMSVISGILDPETSKHTAQYQGLKSNVETLKRKVMEFTNLVTAYTEDKMDIGRIEQHADEHLNEEESNSYEADHLGALNNHCHKCGGYGHFARDCATKGKGKGKATGKGKGTFMGKGENYGKGTQKGDAGKGKGKGKHNAPQYGVCWTCGGAHFAKDCTQGGATQSTTKGAGKGEIRTLSSVREVTEKRTLRQPTPWERARGPSRGIKTHNRFQVLSTIEEDSEEEEEPEQDGSLAGGMWWKVIDEDTRRKAGTVGEKLGGGVAASAPSAGHNPAPPKEEHGEGRDERGGRGTVSAPATRHSPEAHGEGQDKRGGSGTVSAPATRHLPEKHGEGQDKHGGRGTVSAPAKRHLPEEPGEGQDKHGGRGTLSAPATRHLPSSPKAWKVLENGLRSEVGEGMEKHGGGRAISAPAAGHLPTPSKLIRRRWQTLRSLVEVLPEGVNNVSEQEWEEIEMAVDSGATETVVGEGMLTSIDTKPGSAFRRGVKYEVASGELIPNLGEKRFVGVCENGETRNMTAQVCDVNKALLSVKRMVQAGNRVVFEANGGYIEDTHTGERIHMKENGGMYMLKMWVQRPFHGQADMA